MAKKQKKKNLVSVHTLKMMKIVVIFVVGVSIMGIGLQSRPITLAHAQLHPQKPAAKKTNTTSQPPPKPVAPPTPAPQTTVTAPPPPAAKPVAPVAVPTSPQAEPVVTPAATSSVSGLTPVAPTTPATTSPSSPSTTPPSSGSPTTPPVTTGYTSSNWSGYMATTGTFTGVSGSWTAPAAVGIGTTTTADSTWIGIGGVSASDLIQIGTQNTISGTGTVTTSAFYEMLPAVSQPVPGITVSPGDSLSATIVQISSGQWTMSITDNTNGQSYTSTVSYASTLSSAEWIEEDPSYSFRRQIPFDNFGTALFTGSSATLNGHTTTIANSTGQPVTMLNKSGQTIATPSALSSGGTGFTVTRNIVN